MDTHTVQLPDDVEALRAMVRQRDAQMRERDAQVAEQQQTIEQLQRLSDDLSHRLDLALRRLYGRSSEKIDSTQLLLFGQAMDEVAQTMRSRIEGEADEASTSWRATKGHGRQPLPADLPRHRIEHPIDASQLTCPCCHRPRVRIGQDVSEQLDYTPASLFVIEHVRSKYACPKCEEGGVATAARSGEGQVIEKGLPGPGLVAHVAVSKYADHAPLYRLEGMLARHGVQIARSTMCGWMKAAADLLAPLVKVMATRIRGSKVIHTDDTPVPVLCPGKGKTRTGRMWAYIGDTCGGPYIVFDYTPTRSRDGPTSWLGDYQGYLHADAFGGYDGIYATGKVTEVACWAHARRKFHDARLSDPENAHQALAWIRLLYDVERQAKELDAPARQRCRAEQSVPLLEQLHDWLRAQRDTALPKSPMGTAIGYALNHWDALSRYVTDGDLAIDNNVAERAIRPLVIGRKNYLHLGSDTGGRTAATLYSVIASAKRQGMDPFIYLRDVLATIGSTPISQLDQFLPDVWKQKQLEEIATG